jgi:hypothetical protein
MAIRSVQSEGIHQQALRVVRAYNALREAPKNTEFNSDDFPFGLFAERLQQIKLLDGWLEPAVESEAGPASLHDQTMAEICEENPEAGDRELTLRVAIRESMWRHGTGGRGLRQDQRCGAVVTRAQAIAAARALVRSGLTVRDVAELLRAHPRAIEALLASAGRSAHTHKYEYGVAARRGISQIRTCDQ